MRLSITSIFSIFIFSLLFSIVLAIILGNIKLLKRVKFEVIFICLAVPVLKMLFPVEIMPWTMNLNVTGVFADFFKIMTKEVSLGKDILLKRWEILTIVTITLGLINVIRVLVGYSVCRHQINSLPEVKDEKLRQMVDGIVKEYGKSSFVSIKQTELVSSPAILGMRKAVILLPVTKLDDLNLDGIIRHEIAHYMLGDIHIKMLWTLVKALYFWNPVVYILNNQIVKILEVRADEKAVEKMTDEERDEYRSILALVSNRAGKEKCVGFSVSFLNHKGVLVKKRIDILEEVYVRTPMDLLVNYAGMVICVVGMFLLMNCFILEPVTEAPPDEYQKTRDVAMDSCFLVKNPEGTYDMYMDGIYCATIPEDLGSGLRIYNSLEEALKNEED